MRDSPGHSCLAAAVEEVGDVGVLLGLRAVQLAGAASGQHLRDRVRYVLLLEHDRTVQVVPVPGHRRQIDRRVQQLLRELSCPVGTEVEEDRGVACLDPRPALEVDRFEELVRHTRVVLLLHVRDGLRRRGRPGTHDRVERALGPLPPLVAIHRVVAAGDGRDPLLRQVGEVVDGGVRRDVAAVGERVDPGLVGCEAEQCAEVVDVRVDASVGDEAEQVDVPAALERPAQGRALEERAVLDRLVHAHQVLEEDPAGADRQMADLGVAHLAGREADRLARRLQRRMRVPRPRAGRRPACRPGRRRCRGRAARSPTRPG